MAAESVWEVIVNDAPFDGFTTGQRSPYEAAPPTKSAQVFVDGDRQPSHATLPNPTPGQGGGP